MTTQLTLPPSIYSLGKMTSELRWPVSRVVGTLKGLGIKPVIEINDVDHYDVAAFLSLMKIAHAEEHAQAAGVVAHD